MLTISPAVERVSPAAHNHFTTNGKKGGSFLPDGEVVTAHVTCGPFVRFGWESKPVQADPAAQYILRTWPCPVTSISSIFQIWASLVRNAW